MSPDDVTDSKKAAEPETGEAVIALPVFTAEDDADPGQLLLEAAHILAHNPGPEDRAIARELVALARTPVQVPQVRAGELAEAGGVSNVLMLDTLDRPDHIASQASFRRLALARNAGALALAVDLADTIGAQNSMEKMLAHQMAAAHRSAMNMMAQLERLTQPSTIYPDRLASDDGANVRAARLANSAARLMATFQQGMTTLQQCRRGGKQEVHVLHQNVQVNEGGQAVVAGRVGGQGRRKQRARAGTKK